MPNTPVLERLSVPVVFATRVIRVEKTGENLLIVFGFDTLDEMGSPVIEVVAKIMRPISNMNGAKRLLDMAIKTGDQTPVWSN